MAFPTSPTNGQVAVLNGIRYQYATATNSWSKQAQASVAFNVVTDTFTGDGNTSSYTLKATPNTSDFLQVNIDGVSQLKSAYTLSQNIITFTSTPLSGQVIEVRTTTSKNMGVLTGLNYDSFTANGSSNTFTLTTTPVSENYTIVTVGGVVQNKTSYSLDGANLVFDTNPANQATVEVTTFGPAINTSIAAGSNTEIQFNNNGAISSNASLTFSTANLTLSTDNINVGNITVTGNLVADGGNLTGQVANALVAGTVYASSQPNITSLGTLTTLNVSGLSNYGLSTETLNNLFNATGNVTHDVTNGATFFHQTPAAQFTPNFTNVPTTDNRVLVLVVIVSQGATPYTVSSTSIQIEGATYTVKWSSNSPPVGSANKIDVVSYSLIRSNGAWYVLGQYATYG